ncbi:uncharacterized protein LOC111631022 [Centruroides sculpturatus]|uniref:uncharacterized protein LOC111631022 n=1 Tax=Centruroides sculpturatus TaxID=218467 RepID=UPI000C6E6696|nr:uncharacterized protein LOC111631022 [Centruroides sculpturatus]
MDHLKTETTDNSTKKPNIPSQPTYLIVHATGETPLSKCSPFLIQKLFESTVGNLKKIQKFRSADLLLETASFQQSAKLLPIKTLRDIEVTVTPHGSLNSSRGVISEIDLMSEDESDIQIGLSDQGASPFVEMDICAAQFGRIFQIRCVASNVSDLDIPSPPAEAKAYVHSVESKATRVLKCTGTPCCVNFKDAHPAYSRKCPAWQREKEIQQVKTVNNISYPEACCMVTPSVPPKQRHSLLH